MHAKGNCCVPPSHARPKRKRWRSAARKDGISRAVHSSSSNSPHSPHSPPALAPIDRALHPGGDALVQMKTSHLPVKACSEKGRGDAVQPRAPLPSSHLQGRPQCSPWKAGAMHAKDTEHHHEKSWSCALNWLDRNHCPACWTKGPLHSGASVQPIEVWSYEVGLILPCLIEDVGLQVERASRAVVTANTGTPAKGRAKPAMESKVCKFFLTADGCKFGDDCHYKHPRTNGKCLRCGAEGHTLSSCTRPSKSKSDTTSKQSTKGKGRSTSTSTPSRPSSTAKPKAQPKAQPKKKSAKGGGKGKKDKPSVKSSTKSSAKAGEVSFDNDDAEEEDHDAECDWDEDEEYVAQRSKERQLLTTPLRPLTILMSVLYMNLDDGELEPMGSTVIPVGPQLDATSEEHWTTDEDAMVQLALRIVR